MLQERINKMLKIKRRLLALGLTFVIGVACPVQVNDISVGHVDITSIQKVDAKKKAKTVYVTRAGKCYHKKKCGRGKYYKVTLKEAKNRGLRKCKKCY